MVFIYSVEGQAGQYIHGRHGIELATPRIGRLPKQHREDHVYIANNTALSGYSKLIDGWPGDRLVVSHAKGEGRDVSLSRLVEWSKYSVLISV